LKNFFFILSIFLLVGCSPEPRSVASSDKAFFDLGDYFSKQYQVLQAKGSVQKTTSINGLEETQTVDSINFKQELVVFVESDINRTSWMDKYQADSTFNDSRQLVKIEYSALDEKLRTRKLVVTYHKGIVEHISIRNASKNIITDAEQILDYSPTKGYKISSRQKVILSPEKQLGVEVVF